MELWERIACRIGHLLSKYHKLDIDYESKIARLYRVARFEHGRRIELVGGKWPTPGQEEILIDGGEGRVTVNRCGFGYYDVNLKVKNAIREIYGFPLEKTIEDEKGVERGINYDFSMKKKLGWF